MESLLFKNDLLTGHEPGGGPLSPALSPRCGARGPETEGVEDEDDEQDQEGDGGDTPPLRASPRS